MARPGAAADPRPHHYLMLLALLEGDLHGLGIARAVEQLSEGKVRLWPATLYGSLQELDALGWVEELRDPAERPRGAGERKRVYRITARGRVVMRGETRRLADLVKVAQARVRRGESA